MPVSHDRLKSLPSFSGQATALQAIGPKLLSAAMPHVTFVLNDGSTKTTEGAGGDSLMQVAINHTVPGIEAICGGFCNCATCHVYIDAAWLDRVPPVSDEENDMLDGTASDRLPNSRLSCQLKMTPELDGIIVVVPERQA